MDRKKNGAGQAPKKSPPTITAISVSGFKSIRDEQRIEIRPLTILAGANSSGKSSIMQPLLLMKQTLEAPFDPGPLRLDGPNVNLSSFDQVLSKGAGSGNAASFIITIEQGKDQGLSVGFSKVTKEGVRIDFTTYRIGEDVYTLKTGLSEQEIIQNIPATRRILVEGVADWNAPNSSPRTPKELKHWQLQRDRCILTVELWIGDSIVVDPRFFPRSKDFQITRLTHLPGLRGNPARSYKKTAVGGSYPGTFENYVASIILRWQTGRSKKLDQLNKDLEDIGLSWKVASRQVNDTQIELQVGRLAHSARGGARDLVNIADVGFGVSQSLPVLVALLAAGEGDVVYLEQPEIHLHPNAQRAMAKILAHAAKRGVRVIAETHSSLLLEGIQTLVAKGELDPSLVKLHWFQRDPKTGFSTVTSADLDENGAFGDKWPADFDEVALKSQGEYLDAVEKRMFG